MFGTHCDEGLRKLMFSDQVAKGVEARMELWEDFARFAKRASSETIFGVPYSRLAPPPGHMGIHVVALGDFETYGANRNADTFPKRACQLYHDTFVQHGCVFRDHNNRDRANAIGAIKASAYNEPMGRIELFLHVDESKAQDELHKLATDGDHAFSMACRVPFDRCYPAGTQVLTKTGFCRIEQIETGAEVFTHQRHWRSVTATHANEYTGSIISVEALGVPDFSLTANHPIFVVRGAVLRSQAGRRYTVEPGTHVARHFNKDLGDVLDHVQEVRADALEVGDYLVTPIGAYTSQEPAVRDVALAYVIGRYAGDGCAVYQRRGRGKDGDPYLVGLSFSCDDDAANTQWLVDKLTKVTSAPVHTYSAGSDRAGSTVVVYDRKLARTCIAAAGEGWHNKRLPLNWSSVAEVLGCLAGCVDADGTYDAAGGHIRVCAGSAALVYGAWKLGLDSGMLGSLHREAKRTDGSDGGYPRTQDHIWVACWSRTCAHMLSSYSHKARGCEQPTRQKHDSMRWGDYVVRRITALSAHDVSRLPVYNLTVDTDATYVAACVSTHNCNKCNALRKSAADPNQCAHVRDHLGEVFSDGTLIATHNDQPTWFDQSFVRRPADRIAFYLKAAGCARPDSVKLAEASGLWVPDALERDVPGYADKHALVVKLARLETEFRRVLTGGQPASRWDSYMRALVKGAAWDLDDAAVDGLRAVSPDRAFEVLARRGVVLSAPTFFKFALGPRYGELADAMPAILADVRGGLFGRLCKQGAYQRVCRNRYFDVDTAALMRYGLQHNDELASAFVDKIAAAGTFVGPGVDQRIIEATVTGRQPEVQMVTLTKTAAEADVHAGAQAYAAYKLSALCAMLNCHKQANEDRLLALAAVQDLV